VSQAPETESNPSAESALPPRPVLVAAAALSLALVVAVAVLGLTLGGEEPPAREVEPLPLAAVAAPKAGSPECARLMDELPDALKSSGTTLPRRQLADPAPEAAAAWGEQDPVVLRCGVGKPAELKPTSKLVVVDDVRWFPVQDAGTSTWYLVGKPVTVAVTLPGDAGTGVMQDLSKAVAAGMPN